MAEDNGSYHTGRPHRAPGTNINSTQRKYLPSTWCQRCKEGDCELCSGQYKAKYGHKGPCECKHRKLKKQQDAQNRIAGGFTFTPIQGICDDIAV